MVYGVACRGTSRTSWQREEEAVAIDRMPAKEEQRPTRQRGSRLLLRLRCLHLTLLRRRASKRSIATDGLAGLDHGWQLQHPGVEEESAEEGDKADDFQDAGPAEPWLPVGSVSHVEQGDTRGPDAHRAQPCLHEGPVHTAEDLRAIDAAAIQDKDGKNV